MIAHLLLTTAFCVAIAFGFWLGIEFTESRVAHTWYAHCIDRWGEDKEKAYGKSFCAFELEEETGVENRWQKEMP